MMAIFGTVLKKGLEWRESQLKPHTHPQGIQRQLLRQLLLSARQTAFGKTYDFKTVLKAFRTLPPHRYYEIYKEQLPIHTYETIYNRWWKLSRQGQQDVCWPGKIRYYAMSSGTSGASSKYIPVSQDWLRTFRKTSVRQVLSLGKYDLPVQTFTTGALCLGGSTSLIKNSHFFDGDISGITTSQVPFWFQPFYKPGQKISSVKDWNDKLERICRQAHQWDIGFMAGVPAWCQMLLEMIIERYRLNNIHELWPNLSVFSHGGVAFEPYRKSFDKLLGRPIHYIDTYMASEGFLGFQPSPDEKCIRLALNAGVFFEFVPFHSANFDENGEIHPQAEALLLEQCKNGKEYALVISTNAGCWRYLIGDVVKMIDKRKGDVQITGRTKHFLSLCGEHLSVDNMNKAIEQVAQELNVGIKEFAVAGVPYENLFAHQWYVGTTGDVSTEAFRYELDEKLKQLNDDYATERSAALKEVMLTVLPAEVFYEYMEKQGKIGAQNKFPRVLKGEKLQDWQQYLASKNYI